MKPRPVVKVPMVDKWYGLEIHHPSGEVETVPFPDMGSHFELGSPYVDHVPNPRHVAAWARPLGYAIDSLSFELMVGRWELESSIGRWSWGLVDG